MSRMILNILFILITILIAARLLLYQSISYENHWMDSPLTRDISLTDPTIRVSTRFSTPSSEQLQRPVIIAVHGYSASTYEWKELSDYADSHSDVLVSRVLLGGHGRDIYTFSKSTWQDWGRPILEEYHALVDLGYTNISFAASSAGCSLLLHHLSQKAFDRIPPRHITFVDPFIIARDTRLRWVPYLGFFLGTVPEHAGRTDLKLAHWYNQNPVSSLTQLQRLITHVSDQLDHGISLPTGTTLTVFQGDNDPVSDPMGAGKITEQVQADSAPTLKILSSDIHVLVHGASYLDSEFGERDLDNQRLVFHSILLYP